MRNAKIIASFAIAALAIGGCNKQQPADQNISIDAGAADNQMAGNADIEMLPADESSTTPSNELQNGFDSSGENDVGNEGNSY
jgi:hypothetical protein